MPVTVVCPSCKAKLKAPDNLVGKAVKCPGCGSAVLVKAVAAAAPNAASGPIPKAPALAKGKTAPPPPKRPQAFEDIDPVDEVEDIEDYEDEPVQSVAKGKKAPAAEEADRGPVPDSDKTMGLLLHLSSFIVGIIGPVVLWIIKRKESPFIDHHGKQHLNFVATLFCLALILGLVGGTLTGVLFWVHWIPGVIVGGLLGLFMMALAFYSPIMIIIAAFKAKSGVWYRFPMTLKLFK